MPLETTRFDILEYLETPEDRLSYIEAALEDSDLALIVRALRDVARSVGMTMVAQETGVTPEALDEVRKR